MREAWLVARVAIVGAVAAVLFVSPAGASCSTSFRQTVDVPGVVTFYVDDRSDNPPVPGFLGGQGTFVYEESNGVADLQRGGTPWIICSFFDCHPDYGDPCVEFADPDDLWF